MLPQKIIRIKRDGGGLDETAIGQFVAGITGDRAADEPPGTLPPPLIRRHVATGRPASNATAEAPA